MPANSKPSETPATGTTGGHATPIVQSTPVLGDEVVTEGASTAQGTITSHSGPPQPTASAAGGPPLITRVLPPAAVPVAPRLFTVKNMLPRQPLHSRRTGKDIPAGGTFEVTEEEFLSYGAQVARV